MDRQDFARQQRAYQAERQLDMVQLLIDESVNPTTTKEQNHVTDAE